MAHAVPESDSTTSTPSPRRFRPVLVIAAVAVIAALAILAIGAANRPAPEPVAQASTGDRAKHGYGHRVWD